MNKTFPIYEAMQELNRIEREDPMAFLAATQVLQAAEGIVQHPRKRSQYRRDYGRQ